MSGRTLTDGWAFADYVKALSAEEREKINARQRETAEREHADFKAAFVGDGCYICGEALSHFDRSKPCVHWLLHPTGFTKRDFPLVYGKYDLFQIQGYLRWVASEEAFARNINDLHDEGTGKLVELTIRYQDFDWAFSCGKTDFEGHESGTEESRVPHYHFQMRYKRQAFIRYNDFHIPLSVQDIGVIEMRKASPEIRLSIPGGIGMAELLAPETLEHLVATGHTGGVEGEEPIRLETLVMAAPGTQISGSDIADLIEEARAKKVTVSSLLPRLKNTSVGTIVTPGAGVVEQAPRSGRNRPGGKPGDPT